MTELCLCKWDLAQSAWLVPVSRHNSVFVVRFFFADHMTVMFGLVSSTPPSTLASPSPHRKRVAKSHLFGTGRYDRVIISTVPGPAHYGLPPSTADSHGGVVSESTRDARAKLFMGAGTGSIINHNPGFGAYRSVLYCRCHDDGVVDDGEDWSEYHA